MTLSAGAEGATTAHGGDMVVWTSGTGAYGGLTFNGSVVKPRKDWNTEFYGGEVGIMDILNNKPTNTEALSAPAEPRDSLVAAGCGKARVSLRAPRRNNGRKRSAGGSLHRRFFAAGQIRATQRQQLVPIYGVRWNACLDFRHRY